jgi:hypothetical protein
MLCCRLHELRSDGTPRRPHPANDDRARQLPVGLRGPRGICVAASRCMFKPTTHPQRIDNTQLVTVTGGGPIVTDPTVCTPDNPRGERIWHQSAHSYPRR